MAGTLRRLYGSAVNTSKPGQGVPVDGSAPAAGAGSRPAGYDVDQVAASARQADPGLPPETATALAAAAWRHLRAAGAADPAEIARRLLAEDPRSGATAANVVAVAAVEYCASRGLDPGGSDQPA